MSHPDHPKHVVPVNVHVVVVNLVSELGRSGRTGVQVKSNEGERASMLSVVRTDEFALTETHVSLERQPHGGVFHRVCSYPAAADMRQSHEPVEVRDLRRVADIGQWRGRT